MLAFVADFLTTVFTVLFPVFASYKALRTTDPAQLTPWLMYWVILSLVTLAEMHLYFILSYVPFYAWLRLFFHLYLVLPGKGGATHLYTTYLHPWLSQHEQDIEQLIGQAHDKAKQAGWSYLKQAYTWFKVNVLNQPPEPSYPPQPTAQTYAQQLLARFAMPSVSAPAAGDLYGLLSSALTGVAGSGASREKAAEDLAASGTLLPPELEGKDNAEKMRYVSTTRESLRVLLQAFDKEAFTLASGEPTTKTDLSKSKSETDFEKIGEDELTAPPGAAEAGKGTQTQKAQGGGWTSWIWGQGQPQVEGEKKTQ